MEDIYSWRLKGLARGVDPMLVVNELQRLQEQNGALIPELIVEEARDKGSVLHPLFEWDDKKAAQGYRLQQARILLNNIQVKVISDGEPKEISVCEVVSNNGGYKTIDTFTKDDIAFIKANTISQLTHLKNKLKFYNDFSKAIVHIEQAIECIN
jgi:hypothetical protein